MRRILYLLLCLNYAILTHAQSQGTPLTCVFYVDDRPIAQHTIITGNETSLSLDIGGIEPGLHALQAIAVDNQGRASLIAKSMFMRVNSVLDPTAMKLYYSIDGQDAVLNEGTYSNGCYHLNIDVSSLANGLHNITSFMMGANGETSDFRSNVFMKRPVGGNNITAYDYWVNDDTEHLTHMTVSEKNDTYNLVASLNVNQYPLRYNYFGFGLENGTPYMYARNDVHVRFYDVDGYNSEQSVDYNDFRVKEEITTAAPIEPGTTTKPKPGTDEIHWYTIPVHKGDSVSLKTDKACTIRLFAPSGTEAYCASGAKATKTGGVHLEETGTYYLALHDVTAKSGANISLEYEHVQKYDVLDTWPTEVGNQADSEFYLNIFGNGLDKIRDAKLKIAELLEYVAYSIEKIDRTHAKLKFRLPGASQVRRQMRAAMPYRAAQPNEFSLQLSFEDEGEQETIDKDNVLALAEPEEGELDIEIRSDGNTASPCLVYVTVTNTGNLVRAPFDLCIACSDNEKVTAALASQTGNQFTVSVPQMDGGESLTYTLSLTSKEATTVDVKAWQNGDDENVACHTACISMPGTQTAVYGYLAESRSNYIKRGVDNVFYRTEMKNSGTDPVHQIAVETTIDGTKFDLATFRPASIMMGSKYIILNGEQSFEECYDLSPALNAWAKVSVNYNTSTGKATWSIAALDPETMEETTDSEMALIEAGGMGEISFNIKMKDDLADGASIANSAKVKMGASASAVTTNTYTNIIDRTLPASTLDGTIDSENITLDITGSDTGSGIWHYEVYQQYGETGEWQKVCVSETATVTLPIPAGNLDHGYCVIAVDKAGNREEKELHRELTFRDVTLGDLNGDGEVNVADIVAVVTHIKNKTYVEAADLNNDNEINVADIVSIVSIIKSQK